VVKLFAATILPDDLSHPDIRKLYDLLIQNYEEGISLDPSALIDAVEDPKQRKILAEVVFSKYQLSRGWTESGIEIERADPIKIAADVFNLLKRRMVERMIEENQQKLKEASKRGDNIIPYMEQHRQLLQKKKEIESKE
ncbi:MAG: hypothetical protein HY800_01310, partial [Ignavibacteriales bacterium]|nr:hypothetical protein [Ignavibacteriales bacterium]